MNFPPGRNVLRATLTNGLQVVIVRNTLAPVVTTMINYRVGSDECPAGFPGMAHATEHMMFRGSPGLSADQLAAISAAFGGDDDADTQQAVTQFFFTTPADNLDVALRVEATRMRDLLPDPSLWDKERGAIEQEVAQDLSNPEYVFYEQLLAAMFKGSPYAHDALGTRPSFDKTTGADLRKFHNTWYAPNNAILIIAGNVEPQAVLKQVQEVFGPLPAKPLPARPEFDFQPVKPDLMKLDTDLPYGLVAFTFRFPGSDNSDFAAAQIMSDVLSSQRGKLYSLVPKGKALFAEFDYETLQKSGLGYALAGFPAGGDSSNLLDEVKEMLTAEITNGFSADLVEAAKRREILNAELQKNSVSGLASAWSTAVAVEGRNSPGDDIDLFRAVTVDDVSRVARKYLDFDHAISAILTPAPSGKPISSKSFGGGESLVSTKNANVKLPSWAKKITEQLPVPATTLNPFVTNLANGIKLIVQPETVSDTVNVYGRIKNNPKVQMPGGQDGVDEALDKLFSYGTKSLDRIAFQKALDDIGANESAGADFSLQVLPEDFDRGVQLLADNELSPALPEEDFKIIQSQLAASAAGELQSPDHIASHALTTALFTKGDPAQRETTPESVKSLTIDDVRNYYHAAFRPDLTTIVVIGKITPENAVAAIERYFGNWQVGRTETEHAVPSGAGQFRFRDPRAGRQPRTGQGDIGGNAAIDPDERRLLRAATGQSRSRRRLLRHAPVSRPARKERVGLFCGLVLQRWPDARHLSGGIRLRPAERFPGARRHFERPQGNADEEGIRTGIAPGQTDDAARHSAVGIERGLDRQRLVDVFGAQPAARRTCSRRGNLH